MKKSIIIIWGILLLIRQGTMIGSQEWIVPQEFRTKIGNTDIIIMQGDITRIENVNAIVNPTNYNLDSNTEVAEALKEADPKWHSNTLTKLASSKHFKEGKRRAIITRTGKSGKLRKNHIHYIISTVGPTGKDPEWESKLLTAYTQSLAIANISSVESIIFPPISTGINSLNKDGTVIITPYKAAKIATKVIKKYLDIYKKSSLKTIFFISKIEDGPMHVLAYKKTFGLFLDDAEEQQLADSEQEYISKLEEPMRFRQQQEEEMGLRQQEEEMRLRQQEEEMRLRQQEKEMGLRKQQEAEQQLQEEEERIRLEAREWKKKIIWRGVLALGTLSALLYLLKKYYPSR